MSKILIVAAVAALVATPALAKAPISQSDNLIDSDVTLKGGKIVGQDPDAKVRFELQRDSPYY